MSKIVRNLTTAEIAELSQTHTRPVHLVELVLETGSVYLSESVAINFNGQTYVEGSVKVGTFAWSGDGGQTGEIELGNAGSAGVALVLANGLADIPINIWQVYVKSDGSFETPKLYIQGYGDGGDLTPSRAKITVVQVKSTKEFYPQRAYLAENGFNHLPLLGATIFWEGEKFELESG